MGKFASKTITETLHFILQGRYFTEKVQDLILEHKMTRANQFLDSLIPLPTFEQRQAIIKGEAQFIGWTLCKNENCEQCTDLRKEGNFRFVMKADLKYQNKIEKHKEYLDKYCLIIDEDTTVGKTVLADLIIAKTELDGIKKLRYKQGDYQRLEDKSLRKKYIEALDGFELSQDRLYQEFGVSRQADYQVGTREWKTKLDVNTVLDVVLSKAITDPKIDEMIRQAINTGTISAMTSERLFSMMQETVEDKSILAKLANQIKRKKPAKATKETITLAGFKVPKNLIDDYANAISMSNTSAMVYKAKFGELDPIVEMRKFQGRIELHKKIFKAVNLPYHQNIDYKKKELTKKQKQSVDLQEALSQYLEKN